MSLGELQASSENISIWTAMIWCLYPMAILVTIELITHTFDDDDDQDGGKMIPILQGAQ